MKIAIKNILNSSLFLKTKNNKQRNKDTDKNKIKLKYFNLK